MLDVRKVCKQNHMAAKFPGYSEKVMRACGREPGLEDRNFTNAIHELQFIRHYGVSAEGHDGAQCWGRKYE